MSCSVRIVAILASLASTCVGLQKQCTDVDCDLDGKHYVRRDSREVSRLSWQRGGFVSSERLEERAVTHAGEPGDATAENPIGPPLEQQFDGLRVALAWHGIYQRHVSKYRGTQRGNEQLCTDYWHVASNIRTHIVDPLAHSGAQVRNYVHTYTREDCPLKDKQLLDELQPVRSEFWNISDHRIVDSYIAVLKLVLQDQASIDFIIMLRFDVGYTSSIVDWNMTLDTVGVPYMDSDYLWDKCSMVSDLLFSFPTKYTDAVIHALNWSGSADTERLHIGRGGVYAGQSQRCAHSYMHGPGHFLWQPLATEIGEENIRVIDWRHHTSRQPLEHTPSFLGIDRYCRKDYFEGCPNADTQWKTGDLWLADDHYPKHLSKSSAHGK